MFSILKYFCGACKKCAGYFHNLRTFYIQGRYAAMKELLLTENESGKIPDSFSSKLIFICLSFWINL